MPGSQTTTAREALLAAAARVFSDKGFFGTRITDITTAAGVSAGSFYTYFESKEEILGAVMDAFRAGETDAAATAPAGTAADAEQWLRASLGAAVAMFVENARMWRAVQQAALGTEQIRARVRDHQDEVVAAVSAGVAPIIDNGVAQPRTPAAFVARALVAMTEESLFQWYLLHDDPIPEGEAVDRLVWAWQRLLRIGAEPEEAGRG